MRPLPACIWFSTRRIMSSVHILDAFVSVVGAQGCVKFVGESDENQSFSSLVLHHFRLERPRSPLGAPTSPTSRRTLSLPSSFPSLMAGVASRVSLDSASGFTDVCSCVGVSVWNASTSWSVRGRHTRPSKRTRGTATCAARRACSASWRAAPTGPAASSTSSQITTSRIL